MVGNYVGDRLETIRAHQADVRVDWSASNNDKIFGRFSFAEYEQRIDKRAFPLLLGSSQDAPFRNLAFNWNRIFTPSLVNELLVGYNQVAIVNHTTRLERHRERQRDVWHCRRTAHCGSELDRLGRRADVGRRRRQRFGHARQDVSDQ